MKRAFLNDVLPERVERDFAGAENKDQEPNEEKDKWIGGGEFVRIGEKGKERLAVG